MNKLLSRSKVFLKHNASTILTCAGGVGAIATAVTAVRATPKAMRLIEEAREEKGEDLTKLETVVVAGPAYIPSILLGASTLACIFGANVLSKRQQAVMASAYALLDNSYKEYKKKVEDIYGEDASVRVREEIAKDKYTEMEIPESSDKELFYDYFSNRYFEASMADVLRAEYELNRKMVAQDYAYLNDFYELLDLEPIEAGYEYGWSMGACQAQYWVSWIDFDHEKVTMDDGLECYILVMRGEPIPDFAYFA